MSQNTISGAAATPAATAATDPAASAGTPSKEDVIARVKSEIEKLIVEAEAALGHELTDLRSDLVNIEADAETFWDEVKAWFHKHL